MLSALGSNWLTVNSCEDLSTDVSPSSGAMVRLEERLSPSGVWDTTDPIAAEATPMWSYRTWCTEEMIANPSTGVAMKTSWFDMDPDFGWESSIVSCCSASPTSIARLKVTGEYGDPTGGYGGGGAPFDGWSQPSGSGTGSVGYRPDSHTYTSMGGISSTGSACNSHNPAPGFTGDSGTVRFDLFNFAAGTYDVHVSYSAWVTATAALGGTAGSVISVDGLASVAPLRATAIDGSTTTLGGTFSTVATVTVGAGGAAMVFQMRPTLATGGDNGGAASYGFAFSVNSITRSIS